jgi:lysophospholipase L1-like esterase
MRVLGMWGRMESRCGAGNLACSRRLADSAVGAQARPVGRKAGCSQDWLPHKRKPSRFSMASYGRLAIGLVALVLTAQTPRQLTTQQAQQLMSRSLELMEAAGVALPEMARAGAPLAENARQALAGVKSTSANLEFYNTFESNVRAFLFVAESLPKPPEFPDQARRQLAELRDNFDRLDTFFAQLLVQRDIQLRSPDRDNLHRYTEANARVAPPRAANPRVVFLGDSITDGWRLNEYYGDRDFINRGIGGQITGEMLGRMLADVVNLQPQAVLILAGTNDISRGVPLATIESNLTMIADLADYYKIKVILASVLPVSDYHKDVNPNYEMTKPRPPALIKSLNGWMKNLCASRGYTWVDYFSAMVDDAGMMKADLADDGLHPNSKGYRIMAPLALEAIDKTLKQSVPLTQPPTRKRRLLVK